AGFRGLSTVVIDALDEPGGQVAAMLGPLITAKDITRRGRLPRPRRCSWTVQPAGGFRRAVNPDDRQGPA
ncbi:hypothetical protein, partial [Streptomyces sp. NPDC001274]